MTPEVGQQIQFLRKRSGLSIRQLAERADVTPGIISCIERGKNSPSILTLQKILEALGSDLATFFGNGHSEQEGPVFYREKMQAICDNERHYTMIFAKHPGVEFEMLDELIEPTKTPGDMETLQCDVGGYVLSGLLELEIAEETKTTLRPGDAFYITKGKLHRGRAVGDDPVRLITVCYPPSY